MKKTLNENILGLFPDKSRIEQCVSRLRRLDFSATNISVEKFQPKKVDPPIILFGRQKRTKAPESAITSGFIGVGLGATLGTLLHTALSMEIWSCIFLGMLIFGTLGAFVGGMVGHMVQENDESDQARDLKGEEVLLTVHVEDEEHAKLAQEILQAAGARIQIVPKEKFNDTVIHTHL